MDKMREEFEAWAENYYDELWVHLCERTKVALFDCYADAWQASRQALVVKNAAEAKPNREIKKCVEKLKSSKVTYKNAPKQN